MLKGMYFENKHGDPLLRIPNAKRIWFWYETAPANASELSICKQCKNSAYSQLSRPISHIVWTD